MYIGHQHSIFYKTTFPSWKISLLSIKIKGLLWNEFETGLLPYLIKKVPSCSGNPPEKEGKENRFFYIKVKVISFSEKSSVKHFSIPVYFHSTFLNTTQSISQSQLLFCKLFNLIQ